MVQNSKKKKNLTNFFQFKKYWQLYALIFVPVLYIFVFKYMPMYGARIAFVDYVPRKGVMGSEWVGLEHFIRFLKSPQSWTIVRNTLAISLYTLILTTPFPIILALSVTYLKSNFMKKTVQMVTYLPHFLSTVIIISLMHLIFNTQSGIVNNVVYALTGDKINFLGLPKYFRSMYVWSGIWQGVGWSSIIYISALAGVDPQIHEAAIIDGANKIKRIWYIDLASIVPTVSIMLIMNMGSILSVGFDKTYLMQNPTNLKVSQVLSTYEYNVGIGGGIPSYSYPSAISLMSTVITFILICITNALSKKLSGSGLW